ncbi:MAG: ComF family protein [Anaerolineae bacterium]|nr:ComF family protein [Anaerolineae bacterium]
MSPSEPRVLSSRESLARFLVNLLFPPRCMVCRRMDTWLCPACVPQLPWLDGTICTRCGLPIQAGELCPRCAQTPLRLDGIRSALLFDGPAREAIHRLKYRQGRQLAEPLGGLLRMYWEEHPLPVNVIVPVPLHPSRLRQRGYNQAALLARELGRKIGLPVNEKALLRVRATASQMRLSAADRRRNVQDAFQCSDDRVAGQKVLLLDDVCTTGATLEACADALHSKGAAAVWALTLARAP